MSGHGVYIDDVGQPPFKRGQHVQCTGNRELEAWFPIGFTSTVHSVCYCFGNWYIAVYDCSGQLRKHIKASRFEPAKGAK